MKLSCILPCYREEANVFPVCEELSAALDANGISHELIFVNDGSPDGTLAQLKKLAKAYESVRVINFSRNFGKEAAILAGLNAAKGDYVTLIDADMQQPPETVLEMVAMLDADAELDCVAAYQKTRRENGLLVFCKKMFYKLINRMTEVDLVPDASDFRTFRRNVLGALLQMTEYHRFSKGIFPWIGFQTAYIPYEVRERNAGKTSFSFWKLFKYAMEGIVAFTTAPLKLAIGVGLTASLLSIIYLIVVVLQRLISNIAPPGYATTVVLILLMGGLNLLFLGIIGEYLARTYIQSKNRPIYIIKEEFGGEKVEEEGLQS